jgi:hypothetical protein
MSQILLKLARKFSRKGAKTQRKASPDFALNPDLLKILTLFASFAALRETPLVFWFRLVRVRK